MRISYVLVGAFPFLSNIRPLIILPVLDPNVKHLYCCHLWETEQFDAGMRRLEEVVCDIFGIAFNCRSDRAPQV
jgi:hypothetical protein